MQQNQARGTEQSDYSRSQDTEGLFHIQQSALEMTAKLNKLAFDYAVELNRTWAESMLRRMKHFSDMPHRLAECRTPEEFVSANAEMIQEVTQEYKKGFDRLANVGQEMAQESRKAMEQAQHESQSGKGMRDQGRAPLSH